MPTINYKRKNGERVSGTTTIISQNLGWNKQQLMWWANQEGLAGRNHRETAQRAADAGTIAHYLIECDIKGRDPDTSNVPIDLMMKADQCFENYKHWKETVNFVMRDSELSLVSEKWGYGSTVDCIAVINGKLCLFDWKSSNGVYADYLIQIASYKTNYEENTGDTIEGIYLLRIDKETAAWTFHYWQELPEAWEAFTHLLALHNLSKTLKKAA